MENMLSLVFLGFLCPTSTTLLHGGPIGISLCKLTCKTTFGCKSYTYHHDSYSCYSSSLKNVTEGQAVTEEVKDTWKRSGISNTTCPSLSRIVYSRSRTPVCLKYRNVEGPSKEKNKSIQLKYYSRTLSFADARVFCNEEGGLLAQFQEGFSEDTLKQAYMGDSLGIVSNQLTLMLQMVLGVLPKEDMSFQNWETNFVNEKKKQEECAWIDLTYHKELKQFKWGDGTPYLEEDRWSKHEPSHTMFGIADENCVCVTKSLLLQDIACKLFRVIICQIPLQFLCSVHVLELVPISRSPVFTKIIFDNSE